MANGVRPNIVLINCDDLGWGDLGCYGHPLHATPHLDRLAAEGLRLTSFYAASPVCSPSRGGMLCGCYPPRIGFGQFDQGQGVLFPGSPVGLASTEITFARRLQSVGYATACIGKWHCGDQPEFLPTRHGFDRYYGIPYSNDMGRQPKREFRPPLPLLLDETVVEQQPDQASLTARYTEEAVRFIRAHADQPFLVYLAHLQVHLPIYVQPRFAAESRNGPYGAAVATIDWSLGVIRAELARLGLTENTLIVFTSDNGSRGDFGPSNGHWRGAKATTWEGGQRVPGIFCWPGTIAPGRVSHTPAANFDLYATFCALADCPPLTDGLTRDATDLSPLLLGDGTAGEVALTDRPFFYYWKTGLHAVRHGPWKLHFATRNPRWQPEPFSALYHLGDDPSETTDVAAAHPEVVARLNALAEAARRDLGDTLTGTVGAGCRPHGVVPNPRPLTQFDPAHPYYQAVYDLAEVG